METDVNVNRRILLYSMPIALYSLTTILQWEHTSNMLSALNALVAFMLTFVAFTIRRETTSRSVFFLLAAFSSMAWCIADIGWAILENLGFEPIENQVLWVIYAIPNVLLSIGAIVLIVPQINKWSIGQLVTDLFTTILLASFFMWEVFFEKKLPFVMNMIQLDFTSVASILLDLSILISVVAWLFGMLRTRLPQYLRLVVLGICIYALSDLVYYHQIIHDSYSTTGIINLCYGVAFYCIGIGAVLWIRDTRRGVKYVPLTNVGNRFRSLAIATIPVLMLLLQIIDPAKRPVDLTMAILAALVITLNWWVTRYIQLSVENARLLQQVQSHNLFLEHVVSKQSVELIDAQNKDSMTYLLTRRYFMQLLDTKIQEHHNPITGCILIMDIDRLNAVNLAYSFDAGDFVVTECAKRLQKWNAPYQNLLARMGGGEFGMYCAGEYNNHKLISVCHEIQAMMHEPFHYQNESIVITVSIGVAVLNSAMDSASMIVQNAELALEHAKSQGYSQLYLLDAKIYESAKHSSRIDLLLRQSFAHQEFELFYQPQFTLPGHQLVGAESLLRWKNNELGYTPPSLFIPLAEQTGLIRPLGKWVLEQAIAQTLQWNREYDKALRIGINISPVQLTDEGFAETVAQCLQQSGINPEWLEIEITESIMLKPSESLFQAFMRLRELGLSIAIDDFGAGHASFGYLSTYPFQKVKIDKTLIDNVSFDNINGMHVVKSIIDMSRTIGIQTIAEGVEDEEQLVLLERLGCNQIQGYVWGRPVRSQDFEKLYLQ